MSNKKSRQNWYRKNKAKFAEIRRRAQYKKRYSITPEDYNRMLEDQDFGCKICGKPEFEMTFGRLHVDHDHATGAVRGLLCQGCNIAVGFVETRDMKAIFSYLGVKL